MIEWFHGGVFMYTMKEWAGLVIKQAREELGYTQQYVADEADIDIRTLKKIEEAESDPYFDTLAKLIRILHISPNIMFYAEWSDTGLAMDRLFRQLLHFSPEQIKMITESAMHIRSWYEDHPEEYNEFLEVSKGPC